MADFRIKAAINMDGVPYGIRQVSAGGLKKPLMMTADEGTDNSDFSGFLYAILSKDNAILSKDKDVAHNKNYWIKI
ncbi:hypothetical protein [Paenibacillus sp. B2(2019)]|uniref:hypothetical protein n=1 Tax=Paenibacillus sp. B2(2019) TaxID=2607754 RepID=UPI001CB6CF9C|nr:hypothetical protein [Paenibacillus sp. B2(2019)]